MTGDLFASDTSRAETTWVLDNHLLGTAFRHQQPKMPLNDKLVTGNIMACAAKAVQVPDSLPHSPFSSHSWAFPHTERWMN